MVSDVTRVFQKRVVAPRPGRNTMVGPSAAGDCGSSSVKSGRRASAPASPSVTATALPPTTNTPSATPTRLSATRRDDVGTPFAKFGTSGASSVDPIVEGRFIAMAVTTSHTAPAHR